MLKRKTPGEFIFINASGLKTFAPENARIYVFFRENGQGVFDVLGRIDRMDQAAVEENGNQPTRPAIYSEIGFVPTETTIPANDPDCYEKGHLAVIEKLQELNPGIEFETY